MRGELVIIAYFVTEFDRRVCWDHATPVLVCAMISIMLALPALPVFEMTGLSYNWYYHVCSWRYLRVAPWSYHMLRVIIRIHCTMHFNVVVFDTPYDTEPSGDHPAGTRSVRPTAACVTHFCGGSCCHTRKTLRCAAPLCATLSQENVAISVPTLKLLAPTLLVGGTLTCIQRRMIFTFMTTGATLPSTAKRCTMPSVHRETRYHLCYLETLRFTQAAPRARWILSPL